MPSKMRPKIQKIKEGPKMLNFRSEEPGGGECQACRVFPRSNNDCGGYKILSLSLHKSTDYLFKHGVSLHHLI